MIKKINIGIPERSLKYLVMCGGILLLLLLLGLFPLYQYNGNLASEVKKIKDQIEEQKGLGPVYLNMQKALESKDLQPLPNPKKTTISREEAAKFSNSFKTIAGKSGLMTISLVPDLSNQSGPSKLQLYNAVLKGEFISFRKMLIALSAIPYLDKIEEIRIQQHSNSMEFRIKIWLAISA
jgi:hypothetical protein